MNLSGSSFSHFQIIRTLGRGTYGVVYQVKSPDNHDFVIKSIPLDSLSLSKQQQALKEVSTLEGHTQPHLISYISSCIHNRHLLILMEYAPGGDLQHFISTYKSNRLFMSEKTIWSMVYEICLGLEYLHQHSIIHRDVKCLNLLLDCEKRVKIADMGLCKTVSSKDPMAASQVGTPLYLSPEIIQHRPYDAKVDIWAVGCVAYNLAALEPPFQADNLLTLAKLIVKARPKPIPPCFSLKLNDFVMRMLDKRASTRPSISEVIAMIPTAIKQSYAPPKRIIRAVEPVFKPPTVQEAPTEVLVRPIKVNSKEKIGSISKHPERFRMYIMENSKLMSSRSLCMKPMPNLLIRSVEDRICYQDFKSGNSVRPSSGVIRRDLDMNRVQARPASANGNFKRTSAKELDIEE
jgi:serine/threonine protein kinase